MLKTLRWKELVILYEPVSNHCTALSPRIKYSIMMPDVGATADFMCISIRNSLNVLAEVVPLTPLQKDMKYFSANNTSVSVIC